VARAFNSRQLHHLPDPNPKPELNMNPDKSIAHLGPRACAEIERVRALPRKSIADLVTEQGLRPLRLTPVEREAKPAERRVRQSRTPMNDLELAYQRILFDAHGKENVLAQTVRLQLGNGVWYKPDFFVPSFKLFYEVKGPHAFRGGLEFLKTAAHAHPWAKFRLVWRTDGAWKFQEVLP
jgi:hypothetical protein